MLINMKVLLKDRERIIAYESNFIPRESDKIVLRWDGQGDTLVGHFVVQEVISHITIDDYQSHLPLSVIGGCVEVILKKC